ERAGRAEARVEILTEELEQVRSRRDDPSIPPSELEQENRILQQELVRLQSQAEQLARRLAAAEESPGPQEQAGDEIPPEEEDQYLALTERWRARRKRKKEARLR
ncbi:MAG: hypothetical protein M3280_06015, partial [Actinomycetota bacterium]|nr:hypothetical protein [Actinomycetota bacterium]